MTTDQDWLGLLGIDAAQPVLDALPRAIVVTRPTGEIIYWNAKAEHLYGWTSAQVMSRHVSDVLAFPEDREVAAQIMQAVASGAEWRGDFTVRHRAGDPVRVRVINNAVRDATGQVVGIVGASEDVSEQRALEQQAADLTDHLRLALEAGRLGTWRWDKDSGITVWDENMERLFGLEPGTFEGTYEAWAALLHPDEVEHAIGVVDHAVATKSSYELEHRVVWTDGSVHWIQGRGRVTVNAVGEVTGTIGCSVDITERKGAELERARLVLEAQAVAERERAQRERVEFLGRVNEALSGSFDRDAVMASVTRAAVPRLGDWCSIQLVDDDDPLVVRTDTAHVNPERVAYAKRLQEQFPYDPEAETGVALVIRTGETVFYPEISHEQIDAANPSAEMRAVLDELGLRSAIIVPLRAGSKVLGAMQFVHAESGRHYDADDVALAEAVAGRIASVLDNLRLVEQQRIIARTLQSSLLPDTLPTIAGVEVAVRYWAAGEGSEVGGDFYDIFSVPDGAWAIVIGDVCGTGPLAAALTGVARHTIRAAGVHGASPAEALQWLNEAILETNDDRFCTAIYATLAPAPDLARGGHGALEWQFSVTAAGHPLPVLVRANGETATIGRPGTILGVLPDIRTHTVLDSLHVGDSIVLFTDGVTDVSPPHGLTAAQLEGVVRQAAAGAGNAEEIVVRLRSAIEAILPIPQRQDDIAIVVITITGPPS